MRLCAEKSIAHWMPYELGALTRNKNKIDARFAVLRNDMNIMWKSFNQSNRNRSTVIKVAAYVLWASQKCHAISRKWMEAQLNWLGRATITIDCIIISARQWIEKQFSLIATNQMENRYTNYHCHTNNERNEHLLWHSLWHRVRLRHVPDTVVYLSPKIWMSLH